MWSQDLNSDHTSIIGYSGKGPTQGLDDATLTAEAKYSINFSSSNKKICLSLNYNESNCFSLFNATKIYQFKAKDSEV